MAKTKKDLLREALEKTVKFLKKKNADGDAAVHYLEVLITWYNTPVKKDSGSNPGGSPPPPPPGP